jgi:nucleotide-binding universal stress UspA family protein
VETTPTPFSNILCGVEGDPASAEAVQQTIALARGAEVRFVAVSPTRRLRRHSREELQQSLEEAARLALDAGLEVLHISERAHPERRQAVEAQVTELGEIVGVEPRLTEATGHPTHEIVEAARARPPSLLVCGRRGLHGIRALGSVSERVVHRVPCSVLLVPASES